MKEQVEKTRKFMLKINDAVNKSLPELKENGRLSKYLRDTANVMLRVAKKMEDAMSNEQDPRFLRTQLMIEELGETILGLANCDEVETLDGLSDLTFVTTGTAIAFGLPIVEGFDEVCDSNLTKSPRKEDDVRLRDKGPDYVPPNMERVLSWYRGVDVLAELTNCMTDNKVKMTVHVKRQYHKDLQSWWIYISSGGVTGYESMREKDVKTMNMDGWCACGGTKGKYDKLFLPGESMRKIREWLEQ